MNESSRSSITQRDIYILKERIDNPSASSRELSDILEQNHNISLSHNRINEILNELSEEGFYKKAFIPSEELFSQYLFQLQFNYSEFGKMWEECFNFLVTDPHVMMFFTTDGSHNWQMISQFSDDEHAYKWVHNFFKSFGELISDFQIFDIDKIHSFKTDGDIFEDLLNREE